MMQAFPQTSPSQLTAIPVRTPAWRLRINGRDITRDVTPMVTKVTYTDHWTGKVDDLEVTVEDAAGRWRAAWYPQKGDTVEAWIGYSDEAVVPCGKFQIDELEFAGKPDTMTIRALATGVRPTLRTRRSVGYEGQTLQEIAQAVAARHTLTLVGRFDEPQLRLERITQRDEDDLTFLTRVADLYGYVFTVRGEQLVFYRVAPLEAEPPIVTVRRRDVKEYRFKDKAREIYRAVVVAYENPKTKKTITHEVTVGGVVGGEVYKLEDRMENAAQAESIGRATLHELNLRATTGSITLEGEPRLVAGSIIVLTGWGALDGRYRAETSRHEMTRRDGYITTPELKRVG